MLTLRFTVASASFFEGRKSGNLCSRLLSSPRLPKAGILVAGSIKRLAVGALQTFPPAPFTG
jgi:hypothetical protein